MGMVPRTTGNGSFGNAYGVFASAPTAFGPWSFQESAVAYANVVADTAGGSTVMIRRERPKLLLDETTGEPAFLYNGVCPVGNTEKTPAGPNHCYTNVQPVRLKKQKTQTLTFEI